MMLLMWYQFFERLSADQTWKHKYQKSSGDMAQKSIDVASGNDYIKVGWPTKFK